MLDKTSELGTKLANLSFLDANPVSGRGMRISEKANKSKLGTEVLLCEVSGPWALQREPGDNALLLSSP